MKTLTVNKKDYIVNDNEFIEFKHNEYNFLKIIPEVGILERHLGLLKDIVQDIYKSKKPCLYVVGDYYGSFIEDHCQDFEIVSSLLDADFVYIHQQYSVSESLTNVINTLTNVPFILSPKLDINNYQKSYKLSKLDTFDSIKDYYLYVPDQHLMQFMKYFYYYFTDKDPNMLVYNNLIHLCIMVKNGGDLFEKMLTENLHIIDRWTILDTGSTDNTIDIINRVLENKKGNLYQEPFINFRESRNRCLDLAGNKCKFNLMLDDTYVTRGDLRTFLEIVRGDQFADSFSMCIHSDDTKYYSNRITKASNKLRYIYKIHEVISPDNNTNVVVPIEVANIFDYRSDYMEKRTMDRKMYDLKLLFEEIEENPDDPRHYYYVAQTYNLLEEYEKAAEYFLKRANHHKIGFLQEKVDAIFEAARIYNFKLNKTWEECKQLYELCYNLEPERPEALYFIGIHYYLSNDFNTAYPYFVKAFEIGFPEKKQYGLKPTLSFHFLPKFLAQICLGFKNYELGLKCTTLFLQNNTSSDTDFEMVVSMHKLFEHVNKLPALSKSPIFPEKPLICFIIDGGYNQWSGSDILNKGVGGSETWAIEMATNIKKNFNVDVVFFCNCAKPEIFEGVEYRHLSEIYNFLSTTKIHTCIVSRFTEYLSIAYEGFTENVYLVLHDLGPIGNVIPISKKLKKIICLTEWHKQYFTQQFPMCKDITDSFYYGIDKNKFDKVNIQEKVSHSFIYSSFPNRGLVVLLRMWDRIRDILPDATLNIYCDINGSWANQNYPDEMKEIQEYISKNNNTKGIHYHGWVSKKELADAWKKADIWFYPCKFAETFCLTALEAASTKTLAITNGLAALENTVGERGITIQGDVTTSEWQEQAIETFKKIFKNDNLIEKLIETNYKWVEQLTWENRAKEFFNQYIEPYVKLNDHFVYLQVLDNQEHTDELQILQKIVNNSCKSVAIDVGSYTGNISKQLSKYCDIVYAFDIVKEYESSVNYCSSADMNKTIIFENKAIGNNPNTILNKVYLDNSTSDARLLKMHGNFSDSKEYSYIANMTTLDDRFKEDMKNPDFLISVIYIDVNGYENEVIDGAINIIETYKPVILVPSLRTRDLNKSWIFYDKYTIIDETKMLNVNAFFYNEYKQENIHFIQKDDKKHWNILDIGSGMGNSEDNFVKKLMTPWTRGIYVEPNKSFFDHLVESHKNMYPNNENVYINKSVIDPVNLNEMTKSVEKINIDSTDSITLNDIIDKYNIDTLDLIYVDTETQDFEILMSLDINKLTPRYVVFNNHTFDIKKYRTVVDRFEQNGYTIIKTESKNTWLKWI